MLLALLLCLAVLVSPAVAQSVDPLIRRYNQLINSQAPDYAAALALAQQIEAIQRARLGTRHPNYSDSLKMVAFVYNEMARYAEAEQWYDRMLANREEVYGAGHIRVAETLTDISGVYLAQARYGDAERVLQRALAICRAVAGDNHPIIGGLLASIGNVRRSQGRYSEAEALFKQGMAARSQEAKADPRNYTVGLIQLSGVYADQGRYEEAEALMKRILVNEEKLYGARSSQIATTFTGLGVLYERQGRLDEAEAAQRRAIAIYQQIKGGDPAGMGQTLNNLGNVLTARGRLTEAEEAQRKALAIREQLYGADNFGAAVAVGDLAWALHKQNRYAEAEPLYRRALAIHEKTFGPHHPDVIQILDRLGELKAAAGNSAEALALSRRATAAALAHAATEAADTRNEKAAGEVAKHGAYFRHHVAHLAAAATKNIEPAAALGREALELAQRASQTAAAAAVQKMGLRFAAGDGALAALVRQHQDLGAQWSDQDKALAAALSTEVSKQNVAMVERLRGEVAVTERKLAELKARIEKEFPDYAALSSPKPLTPQELQKLLGADEALVFWLAGDKDMTQSFVFAATREGFAWQPIPLAGDALAAKVAAFRRGLDVDELRKSVEAGKPVLFDLALAQELYATLLGPVDGLIKGKKQLLVVPTGALTALPVHLLLTARSEAPAPTAENLVAYRDAAWLMKRQAVTVLPSVASLAALRNFARKDQGTKLLVGFGDPVFGAETADLAQRSAKKIASRRLNTRSFSEFWQGAGVDRDKLAQALPRLADTADELNAVAQKLGAPASDVFLRADANETTVKRVALADYRVVYFATHGLVAGDVKGLAEPSLALTIPKQATETDDGLLTASEIAQLKLNADWVVLSACNTISGDKPGAEALSGLARAFFYAGARALLVSHWAVDSAAATRLTTSTFDILKSDPKLGRAEALRRAMLAYLNDGSEPINAYPAYWAPFSIVGEGATR